MVRVSIFIVLTAGLAYLTRASLRSPGSHGFYRFFAWECIVLLVLFNFRSWSGWFGDPLSVRQLVSWSLLTASLVLAVWGVQLLRSVGRPERDRREDEPLVGIERTTQLVTTGVFKYVRHPLYSSLLFLTWGVFFKRPGWVAIALALGATGFLLATAKAEEGENIRYFGPAYEDYMRGTRRFIPFLF